MEQINTSRMKFSSTLAVFFATLSSVVGLGNIWRFPYLTGIGGGGAFILLYFLFVFLLGLPIMICEMYIGKKTRKNAVGAFKALSYKLPWKYIGVFIVFSSFLATSFYSTVGSWVYLYFFKAMTGKLSNLTPLIAESTFIDFISNPLLPTIWQVLLLVIVSIILISGIQNGIERMTKVLMPVLFILVIFCAVRALMLPNSMEGVKFLFSFDIKKLTPQIILTALGLAFMKLSLGTGSMITYGSYYTEDNNIVRTALEVTFADSVVSLLAGLSIFPAVFSFGMAPESGRGLLFMTIPLVFSKMALGNILQIAFFLLAAIATTTAMIALVEVPVAYFIEEHNMSRFKSVILTISIVFALGILSTLSVDGIGVLGHVKLLSRSLFDLFEYISSDIIVPLAGLATALFIGYKTKKEDVKFELSNRGMYSISKMVDVFYFIVRYIVPILLFIVFLNSSGVI